MSSRRGVTRTCGRTGATERLSPLRYYGILTVIATAAWLGKC